MTRFQNEFDLADSSRSIEINNTSIEQATANLFLNELVDLRTNDFKGRTTGVQMDAFVEIVLNHPEVEAKAKLRTAAEMVKDVSEKFDKATDKPKALKELRNEFNEAIKKADEELAAIKKRVLPDLNAMANEMAEALEKTNPAVQGAFEKVQKLVPEAARRDMQVKMARYLDMAPNHADYQKIRTDFAKYPGMTAAADLAAKELKAAQPIFRKYDPPALELWDAGIQVYRAREEFAKRLKEAGSKQESEAMMKEASDVLAASPDPAMVALDARERMRKTLQQFNNAIPIPKR
jgi:hypothetical protein